MKMYIAVIDEFPDYMTPTLVAHSVLSAHLKFQDIPSYQQWLSESFKKCVLRVNRKEFDKIATLPNVHLGHENNTLNGMKSCAVVCPTTEIPNVLKFAKLWKPKPIASENVYVEESNVNKRRVLHVYATHEAARAAYMNAIKTTVAQSAKCFVSHLQIEYPDVIYRFASSIDCQYRFRGTSFDTIIVDEHANLTPEQFVFLKLIEREC